MEATEMTEDWAQYVQNRSSGDSMCWIQNCASSFAHHSESNTFQSITYPQSQCKFFQWGSSFSGSHSVFNHPSEELLSGTVNESVTLQPYATYESIQNASWQVPVSDEQYNCGNVSTDFIDNWVNAPVFVPAASKMLVTDKTYAKAVGGDRTIMQPMKLKKLCPYQQSGYCRNEEQCVYTHGEKCDLCGRACLVPEDSEQQNNHMVECIRDHEKKQENAFAVAKSKDKICGICFELVMDQKQRFGILPNCNHCFCLSCIRKWRQTKQFGNDVIRGCPECRVVSNFVCPSMFWVEATEEKDKLIAEYKNLLSTRNCIYFKRGEGMCPFGNKCFYLHSYPDGTIATKVTLPRAQNSDGDIEILRDIQLWDFLEERQNRGLTGMY